MLSRLKIAVRINLLLTLAAFGMLVCVGIGLWALRTHMLDDKHAQLSFVMDLLLQDARGDMNEHGGAQTESGRAVFFRNIKRAKFGNSPVNYFFIYDYDGVAVLHPDPSRQGRNQSDVVYPNGVKMVPKFIETAKSGPHGGFLEYDGWDGAGQDAPKISHFRDVPELNAIIGVGVSTADTNAIFFERLRVMASLFALALLATVAGGVIIIRSIREPLSNSIGKISRLANGDLSAGPAKTADHSELGEVDKALEILRANAIEQRALQEKVREQHKVSEEYWRRFVDQAPVAMLVLDRNMVHLACSRRWTDLHAVEAGIGRYHYDLFPQVPEHWREAHRRGQAGETVGADEEMFLNPDGYTQWFRWVVRPWLTSEGSIGGITIMTEDVTDRVLAVQALRESETRMRLAQEAARIGAWELRLSDYNVRWAESIWSSYGFVRPQQWEPITEAWELLVHPDDYERSARVSRDAVASAQEFEVQWRLNVPEGEPARWFLTRGKPIMGADERPDRYFGVIIEITEQKLAEDALRESETRMRLAQEAARAGALEWRLADNSLHFDKSMWTICGVTEPEGFDYPRC
jgi:PAS domain S-box-containing protein